MHLRPLHFLLLLTSVWTAQAAVQADLEKARTWWAFQPVKKPAPPPVRHAAWCRNEVDRFILARLEAQGQHPPPAAGPRALLRRMSYRLTGLPPSLEEVRAFESEAALDIAGAVQRAAARLLASPRYGEGQARHWLDVARYADTKGYVYAREERFFVHSHLYRDWVIRAFNDDLPYDQFLRLQIAADHIVPPHSPDLAAMGFLTLGRRFLGVTHDIIDDRIDIVTRGTMALTVQCARCHDHKYDPVTARDYYALYGVFHAGNERLERIGPETSDKELAKRMEALREAMQKRRAEVGERLRTRLADYLAAQLELSKYPEEGFDEILGADDLNPASVRLWRDFLHTADDTHPIFGPWKVLARIPSGEFAAQAAPALEALRGKLNERVAAAFASPPASMLEAAQRYGALFKAAADAPAPRDAAAEQLCAFLEADDSPSAVPNTGIVSNEAYFVNDVREELWKLQSEVDRWLVKTPAAPAFTVIHADNGETRLPRVFKRGSPAQPGEEVPRRFITFLTGGTEVPFRQGSGRRELADAIASPRNPLTARVMVNRLWQQHFGEGLVKTAGDFGLRAEPPTHPELLDWLAARFIESGWSVKAMHRLIINSAAWQSSAPPRRRLEFEQLRDSLLAATGELDLKSAGGRAEDALAEGSRRRTIYSLVDRQYVPSTFTTFDFPHPDVHSSERNETLVPQQALFFLNSPFVAHRVRALVKRTGDSAPDEKVHLLHRWLYQRDATPQELERAEKFVAAAEPPEAGMLTPWEQYAQVLVMAGEFTFVD